MQQEVAIERRETCARCPESRCDAHFLSSGDSIYRVRGCSIFRRVISHLTGRIARARNEGVGGRVRCISARRRGGGGGGTLDISRNDYAEIISSDL